MDGHVMPTVQYQVRPEAARLSRGRFECVDESTWPDETRQQQRKISFVCTDVAYGHPPLNEHSDERFYLGFKRALEEDRSADRVISHNPPTRLATAVEQRQADSSGRGKKADPSAAPRRDLQWLSR